MKTTHISLSQVRPFIRFALLADDLVHEKIVLPYEHRMVCINEGETEFSINGETVITNRPISRRMIMRENFSLFLS